MHAFGKIRELVILDWYFSGRMETISTKKKGNERKGCQNIVQKLCKHMYTTHLLMQSCVKISLVKDTYFITVFQLFECINN